MRHSEKTTWHHLAGALALSLGVHAAALPALEWLVMRPVKVADERRPLAAPVTLVSDQELERMLADKTQPATPPPPPEKRREEEKKDEKTPELPDKQVVEIPPPPREEVPEEWRFVSDYDSKVEREQVSATKKPPTPRMMKSDTTLVSPGKNERGSADGEVRKSTDTKAPQEPQRAAVGDAKRPSDTKRPESAGRSPQRKVVPPTTAPAPLGPDGDRPRAERRPAKPAEAPEGGGEVGAPREPALSELLPTLGPQDLAESDGSIDHIEDMDEGDRTYLNTREYKYAWFFNRVKRDVQQRWGAVEAHRRNDPYGRVFGVRDRLTVVSVTLQPDGSLEDIYVKKDSGVAFLDEVAVQAFRDAQPFENPPEGLQDADGRIRFQFGFYLEIDGRGFRMFRYR